MQAKKNGENVKTCRTIIIIVIVFFSLGSFVAGCVTSQNKIDPGAKWLSVFIGRMKKEERLNGDMWPLFILSTKSNGTVLKYFK